MPIRFWWRPSDSPVPANADLVNIGLDLGGDNAKSPVQISGSAVGRIKLIEVSGTGDAESAERLLCRFHGTFLNDNSQKADSRITFKIALGNAAPSDPFTEAVAGFDPECMLGIDAFVLTFLNREFVVFLPFMVDAVSEGTFLEIVAVAEVGAIGSAHEIGRSSVLSLRVRRGKRTVNSTSNTASGPLQYSDQVIGNRIAHHESFLFRGASFIGTPGTVFETPIPAASAGLTFSPYVSGAMQIMFTPELATLMLPSDGFLQSTFPSQTLATFKPQLLQQIRAQLGTTLVSIFTDAGFVGVRAFFSDDTTGSALFAEFRRGFVPPSVGNGSWHIGDKTKPLVAPFWHFYVTGSQNLTTGVGAGESYDLVGSPTKTVAGKTFVVPISEPVGSGTKRLIETIRIDPTPFVSGVTTDKNGTRNYKTRGEFDKALSSMAIQVGILAAHEIGHSLGLMHLFRVANGTYSEPNGGSVLTIMSQTVEQSAFALNMMFHTQAKQMWKASFGVSPTLTDTTLLNKTWTDAEVTTLSWLDRNNRFLKKNQVNLMRTPTLSSGSSPPPFAKQPPALQKGTAP